MSGVRRGYVDAGGRPVHFRTCGAGPAVVLLHDSPRSSRLHRDTMLALGDRFTVFALDTPGYGNSAALDRTEPTIPDFAAALGQALHALGLDRAPIYATHTSAKIALALAVRGGAAPVLVLDGLSLPEPMVSEDFIAAYMRPFRIDDDGAHLAAEWSRTRDMLRWFPWFTPGPAARMATTPPSPAWLDDYVIDLFSAGPHYADAYAAAMRWDAGPDLRAVRVPTVVMARRDDVLFPALDRVPLDENAQLTVERLAADRTEWLDRIAAGLAGAPAAAAPRITIGSRKACYLDRPLGQLHWTRAGTGPTTVLALSAPTTLQARAWARALAPDLTVLVPDLPGFGDSDPLPPGEPASRLDAAAGALADLVADAAEGPVTIMANELATPVALRLVARHPEGIARLVIDGAPPIDPVAATAFAAGLCPEIVTDTLGGSHLHRLWHLLRDSEVQWPWHDPSPAAARRRPPQIAGDELHQALVGVLKQPQAWGQAAAAGLASDWFADTGRIGVPTTVFRHGDPAYAEAALLAAAIPGSRLIDRPDDLAAAARLVALPEPTLHG
ncbi:alpha/beta hydrolase [Novosphingobium sp.]|uniref:alpha/beta fold hydrolase n=1 Tax=Novosphingobium sp. TaxID=1874826 RepID=UPI00261E4E07|nr:alpha/beta hydrolase [Novosphingobium sp.]